MQEAENDNLLATSVIGPLDTSMFSRITKGLTQEKNPFSVESVTRGSLEIIILRLT
jgi:hypothetical protein